MCITNIKFMIFNYTRSHLLHLNIPLPVFDYLQDGPIIVSPSSEQACTVGCWSLSRPAVFFIGKEDGSIEVWNLLEKSYEPVQVHAHATNARITCITPWIASCEFFSSFVAPKIIHFLRVSAVLEKKNFQFT